MCVVCAAIARCDTIDAILYLDPNYFTVDAFFPLKELATVPAKFSLTVRGVEPRRLECAGGIYRLVLSELALAQFYGDENLSWIPPLSTAVICALVAQAETDADVRVQDLSQARDASSSRCIGGGEGGGGWTPRGRWCRVLWRRRRSRLAPPLRAAALSTPACSRARRVAPQQPGARTVSTYNINKPRHARAAVLCRADVADRPFFGRGDHGQFHDCTDMTDEDVKTIGDARRLTMAFNLTGCANVTDASVIACSRYCTSLQALTIDGCAQVTDDTLVALRKNNPHLSLLSVQHVRELTDEARLVCPSSRARVGAAASHPRSAKHTR